MIEKYFLNIVIFELFLKNAMGDRCGFGQSKQSLSIESLAGLLSLVSNEDSGMDGETVAWMENPVNDYSIKAINEMSIEDYVVGLDTTIFCNRLENELVELGNIHGVYANKFGGICGYTRN